MFVFGRRGDLDPVEMTRVAEHFDLQLLTVKADPVGCQVEP